MSQNFKKYFAKKCQNFTKILSKVTKFWIIFAKCIKILENIFQKCQNFTNNPQFVYKNVELCKICANSLAHMKYALITFELSITLIENVFFVHFSEHTFQE